MENKIEEFCRFDSGNGYGNGYGSGDGYGYGSGDGYGLGDGSGDGSGYGNGYGLGYGSGDGSGYGNGIKSICGEVVYLIDGVRTLLDQVHGYIAKGRLLMDDLTTRPCWVVKQGRLFAHGHTLREAMKALTDKVIEDMPEQDRIAAFAAAHEAGKPYPNTDFFAWHHKLTGSCLQGREAFAASHGVDMSGSMTVDEFIRLTEHAYGGETIRKLRKFYPEEKEKRP